MPAISHVHTFFIFSIRCLEFVMFKIHWLFVPPGFLDRTTNKFPGWLLKTVSNIGCCCCIFKFTFLRRSDVRFPDIYVWVSEWEIFPQLLPNVCFSDPESFAKDASSIPLKQEKFSTFNSVQHPRLSWHHNQGNLNNFSPYISRFPWVPKNWS